jgi:uncharacterized protein (TIGR02145 family)/uncharacterized repeat protein (TIGR02543 family)
VTINKVYSINTTIYARWKTDEPIPPTPTQYTITFDQNYASAPTATTLKTGTDGKLASLPTNLTRTGYTFKGWWTVSTATGGDSVKVDRVYTADVTVYARWEAVVGPPTSTLTITRNPEAGGNTNPAFGQSNIQSGTPFSISATPNSGYTFNNWTVLNGTATFDNANSATTTVTLTSNAVIRANFQRQQGIVYGDPVSYVGETYQTIVIGTQTWFARNLNYDVDGSKCYNNEPDSCEKYGRLYTWEAAMKACPVGWHLPDTTEWNTLVSFAGGSNTAVRKLDDYGFAALPGGSGNSVGNFGNAGYVGYWWSATKGDNYAWSRSIGQQMQGEVARYFTDKTDLFSVRCM